MEHWWEWVLSILGSGALAAALISVAAYMGRAQLSHWLAKDLEAIKAQHQRDLETYKVGLIAETERAKADQAVKTAKALRLAEIEFAAIDRLRAAMTPYASSAMVYLRHFDPAKRDEDFLKVSQRMQEFTDAVRNVTIFVSEEDSKLLHDLQRAFGAVVERANKLKAPISMEEASIIDAPLVEANHQASYVVAKVLGQMMSME